MSIRTPRSSSWLNTDMAVFVGLLGLAVVVYGRVGGFSILGMDDNAYLTDNTWVPLGFTWKGLRWALINTRYMYWHPITWLSFMVEVDVFGASPAAAHLINLFVHAVNSFLVFWIVRCITDERGLSWVIAALFLLHPLQVESMAWVAERKTLLCGTFAFLSVLAYLRVYAPRPTIPRYLGVMGLFVLAMASKPAAGPLPAVLLALDAWPLRRTDREGSVRLLAEKVPLLLVGSLLSYVALAGMESAGIRYSGAAVPWARRSVEAVAAIGAFFERFVVPTRLSFWYPPPENLSLAGWASAILGTTLLVLAWRCRRTNPSVTLGILWYLFLLIPGLGLERGGVWPFAADRFQYLALPGLLLAAVGLLRGRLLSRRARRFCATATLGVFAAVSWGQTGHWRDGQTLFRYALRLEPERNVQALNGLGIEMAQEGRLREAVGLFEKALDRFPCYLAARNNLALAWAGLGRFQEALDEVDALLKCRPDNKEALLLKSRLLSTVGQLDEAAQACLRALEEGTEDVALLAELGRIRLQQGYGEQAVAALTRSLQGDPADRATVLRDLGAALLLTGQNAQAEEVLKEALRKFRTDPDVLANIGLAVARQGRCREAENYLLRALATAPGHSTAQANLRWLHTKAECGGGQSLEAAGDRD